MQATASEAGSLTASLLVQIPRDELHLCRPEFLLKIQKVINKALSCLAEARHPGVSAHCPAPSALCSQYNLFKCGQRYITDIYKMPQFLILPRFAGSFCRF